MMSTMCRCRCRTRAEYARLNEKDGEDWTQEQIADAKEFPNNA